MDAQTICASVRARQLSARATRRRTNHLCVRTDATMSARATRRGRINHLRVRTGATIVYPCHAAWTHQVTIARPLPFDH